MCELFAFSGAQPALLRFELREFARHSDDTRHAQGWGVAHVVDGDIRLLKEPVAASSSACADFLDHHPLHSTLVLSHIRRATQGATAMRNYFGTKGVTALRVVTLPPASGDAVTMRVVPGPVAIDKLDDSALPPPKGAFPGNKGTTKP